MALSLRKYYPEFYQEYNKLIWIATFLLALPLFIRGINANLYAKPDGKYNKFYTNHFSIFNSAYIFFSTIVPVVAQMGTLIFGARH